MAKKRHTGPGMGLMHNKRSGSAGSERLAANFVMEFAEVEVVERKPTEAQKRNEAFRNGMTQVFRQGTAKARARALEHDGYATMENGQVVTKRS